MGKDTGKKTAYFIDATLTVVPDERKAYISMLTSVTESPVSLVWHSQVCFIHHILAHEGKCGLSRRQHQLGDTAHKPNNPACFFSHSNVYWFISRLCHIQGSLYVARRLQKHSQRKRSCSVLRTSSSSHGKTWHSTSQHTQHRMHTGRLETEVLG